MIASRERSALVKTYKCCIQVEYKYKGSRKYYEIRYFPTLLKKIESGSMYGWPVLSFFSELAHSIKIHIFAEFSDNDEQTDDKMVYGKSITRTFSCTSLPLSRKCHCKK